MISGGNITSKKIKIIRRNFDLKREDFKDEKSYKKEYDRLYNLQTRERRKEIYKEKKEEKQLYARQYRQKNPEITQKINMTRNEKYYAYPEYRKRSLETGWRKAGIKIFENTFNYYDKITHCESCGCELIKGKGTGKNKKVLDHCHHSGYPRNVICHSCNVWRRGFDNRKNILHLELYRKMLLK